MLGAKSSTQLFSPWQIILICFAFILTVILAASIKKLFYRWRYKKRYYVFPKLSNKGIAYIAMAISIAVATILLLAFLTAGILAVIFRAYPGWRITIEGILIKIGGLFFGPIIGIFIGAMTDILTVVLSAGSFHYGYFVIAIVYGFIGGLIRWLWNALRRDNIKFTFVITFVWMVTMALISTYLYFIPADTFIISIFNHSLHLNKLILNLMIGGLFIAGAIVLWTCMLYYNNYSLRILWNNLILRLKYKINPKTGCRKIKYKSNRQSFADQHLDWYAQNCSKITKRKQKVWWLSKQKILNEKINWFNYLVPVLGLILVCEPLVQSVLLPNFDVDFSAYGFEYWVAIRSFNLLWLTPLNIGVIFAVYKIIAPTVNYDYRTDLVEDLNIPVRID